jgi:hypothetical protein
MAKLTGVATAAPSRLMVGQAARGGSCGICARVVSIAILAMDITHPHVSKAARIRTCAHTA